MNKKNKNQPVPLETESAVPEQRQHRPRRRFPRRRYRDRGDRFRRGDSEESPNSSSTNADAAGPEVGVETLDRPASGGREATEGAVETGEQVQTEPEFGE